MSVSATPPPILDALIESWEVQQDAYVHHRAERFGIILDAIEYARPQVGTVLDVGGGPGSFSKLILDRFPVTRVLTLDYDAALLVLARHNLCDHADRSSIVEADVRDFAWTDALDGAKPEVIVSSTALHWLTTSELVTFYGRLATMLPEGGLFFNADHLTAVPSGSLFHTLSTADRTQHQQASFSSNVPSWGAWWDSIRAFDHLAELAQHRDQPEDRSDNLDVTASFHIEALRVGGFTESGTIWQYFDDYVVYGRR